MVKKEREITKEQLDSYIPTIEIYVKGLKKFNKALLAGTTPSGPTPKNPPKLYK